MRFWEMLFGAKNPRTAGATKMAAAKKSLRPTDKCAIHYFSSSEKRDESFSLLISQFGSCFSHIERRFTDRAVMYQHWIVVGDTDAYNREIQTVLEKAGCVEREIQYVNYRTVLADSSTVGK